MKQPDIFCRVSWDEDETTIAGRLFLFCIEDKCMTGEVIKEYKTELADRFELEVALIDPKYLFAIILNEMIKRLIV